MRINSNPIAKGRLSVKSGRRCLEFFVFVLPDVGILNVLPHTRHRVAFSFNFVPQVGHIFILEFLSGFMK